jgi:DMSO/TMAO reductase YedYZ molybdopterin-dependent catalytic subunit
MGIGQLFAGFTVPAASPVVAVGEAAIDHTPLAVKDWATSTFGTGDKTVLLAGVLVVVFLYSMLVGVLAMRRLGLGYIGLTIFAGLGLAAALTRHDATGSYAVPTVFGAIAGAIALRWLVLTARSAARQGQAARAPRASLSPDRLPPIAFDPGATGTSGTGKAPAVPGRDEAAGPGAPAGSSGPGGDDRPAPSDGTGRSDETGRVGDTEGADNAGWGDQSGWGEDPDQAIPDRADDDEDDEDDEDDDDGIGWVAARGPSAAPGGVPAWAEKTGPVSPGRPTAALPSGGSTARRQFLVAAGVSVAAAAIGEIGGRSLATRKNVSVAQQTLRFPKAAQPVAPLPPGVNLPIPGISSFITPNSQFYRVDTALLVPQVDPSNWTLRIHGMVAREITITFDQLLHRPLIEDYLTLTCVSDPVGGPYVGNAKWLGASLAALLREARPQRGADQLLATSVDGFTSGTPLSVVLDGRDALVAVAMNGSALPTEHGFPARLVVPGLYGYVSACKWVVDLEVTTFAAAQGYWVPRGWSAMGPIKTESRIDVPTDGASVKPGKIPVAGVAWAQHKGVEAVEARVDNGPWQEATLAAVPGIDTWRQWVWEWDATSGTHLIEARATDKTGYTQTSLVEDVAPNGASGYPATQVTVS